MLLYKYAKEKAKNTQRKSIKIVCKGKANPKGRVEVLDVKKVNEEP